MSKHQVCPNCHSDFVGPDSNINHNLCRDCDEMIHVDCHKQITELEAENKRLIEEYGEATDTIQDMIDVLKDTKKRLEKSRCPHAIAAGAWLEQALEENKKAEVKP